MQQAVLTHILLQSLRVTKVHYSRLQFHIGRLTPDVRTRSAVEHEFNRRLWSKIRDDCKWAVLSHIQLEKQSAQSIRYSRLTTLLTLASLSASTQVLVARSFTNS